MKKRIETKKGEEKKFKKILKKMKKGYSFKLAGMAFAAHMQCQMICGDGTGKKPDKHVENCPMVVPNL